MFKSLIQTFKIKPVSAKNFFGEIKPPPGVDKYSGSKGQGLFILLNNILKLMIIGAGIFALINFIIAGYEFISAEGDSTKVTKAWNRIWQSALGLVIAAGSFTLAAVLSKIIFGRFDAILRPEIYGP